MVPGDGSPTHPRPSLTWPMTAAWMPPCAATMEGVQLVLAVIGIIITIFALVALVDQVLALLPLVDGAADPARACSAGCSRR
jgi:concentrative nucleoside transporter, CNT family